MKATFARKYVIKNFQKSPNLVALTTSLQFEAVLVIL